MPEDSSNGWEGVAQQFTAMRSNVGVDVIRRWGATLPRGGAVLDIGAGSGVPLTQTLFEDGFAVSAIDASATMIAALRKRFPAIEAACEPAERSGFFNRSFDGAMAIGLMFLLPAITQRELIERVGRALKGNGRFLFSAPHQACTWNDNLTGRVSRSLGADEYSRLLAAANMRIVGNHVDDGGNYYFEAQKLSG